MRLIKLSAIGSTNDYLRELLTVQELDAFTVVSAESQTSGRGQMGAKWAAEPGKNLTFSIFIPNAVPSINRIFDLNIAVSTAVLRALGGFELLDLSLKWPNDIMAGRFKIGGILIESSVKSAGGIHSIAGIGLNVNQVNFEGLPQASSLRNISGKEFDRKMLLERIVTEIEKSIGRIPSKMENLRQSYHEALFRRNVPMAFESENGDRFMGIITGVSETGKLRVMLEDDAVSEFGIKELKMLY